MAEISSFVLQLNHVVPASFNTIDADLLIVESGLNSRFSVQSIPVGQLASLEHQGRQVVGYVNVAVTDHNRTYWNDDWVSYSNPDDRDVGAVNTSGAPPSWLVNNYGSNGFGYIVDFTDPTWQKIVIDQAKTIVQNGFDGVYLDDLTRYYDAGNYNPATGNPDIASFDKSKTDAMLDFVVAIATAVRQIDPDAYVVVNSSPYIGGDSSGGTGGAKFTVFENAIDAILIENQYHTQIDANPHNNSLDIALTTFNNTRVLALQVSNPTISEQDFLAYAFSNELVPYYADDSGYGSLAVTPEPGTSGDDVIRGGDGPNIVIGLAGNDQLFGGASSDTLIGNAGDDTLDGGPHLTDVGDFLLGGPGNDTYHVDHGYDLVDEGTYFADAQYQGADSDYDTIISTADWYWDIANVAERIILSEDAIDIGNDGVTVVGSLFDSLIEGNSKDNIAFGRGGSDTYRMGDGIDWISLSLLGTEAFGDYEGINTIIVEQRANGPVSYDIIFEFEAGRDKVDVSDYASINGYASGADVVASAINDGNGSSYIALGDGLDYLYMVGLEKTDLQAGDFLID